MFYSATSDANLLCDGRLSDDFGVVTVVDDGRIDWDRLFGEKNFNGRGISWYPSDFNGLSEAFGGDIAPGFTWDAIPFDCKNSRWSFDISNVQRAAPPENRSWHKRSREPYIPSGAPIYACTRLGCASVYVLSREAWEKVAMSGLEDMKGLHNIQCWARDLCNSQMPHDPDPTAASDNRLSRLPDMVADDMPHSTSKFHPRSLSNNQEPALTETRRTEEHTSRDVPNRESSKSALTDLTNLIVDGDVSLGPELPERPSWVPHREDSLVMEPVAAEESPTLESVLHESISPNSAYNTPYYDFGEEGLCFPVHSLETVFEVDEETDLKTSTHPTTASDEQIASPSESENAQPSPSSRSLADAPLHGFDALRESETGSSLFAKSGDLMASTFILFLIHVARIPIHRQYQVPAWIFGNQRIEVPTYIRAVDAALMVYFIERAVVWLRNVLDILTDPEFWRLMDRYAYRVQLE